MIYANGDWKSGCFDGGIFMKKLRMKRIIALLIAIMMVFGIIAFSIPLFLQG